MNGTSMLHPRPWNCRTFSFLLVDCGSTPPPPPSWKSTRSRLSFWKTQMASTSKKLIWFLGFKSLALSWFQVYAFPFLLVMHHFPRLSATRSMLIISTRLADLLCHCPTMHVRRETHLWVLTYMLTIFIISLSLMQFIVQPAWALGSNTLHTYQTLLLM